VVPLSAGKNGQVIFFASWLNCNPILIHFIVLQTFLLEGEPPTLDFLGIVFGHVYYHFRKVGMLRAPDWLIKWYDESPKAELLRKKYKTISSDFGV